MQDEQLDIFGGSTTVTRRRNRPAPRVEVEQMALFASDAGELDGQTAGVDLLGGLLVDVEGGPAAGDVVRHISSMVTERITVARVYGTAGNRRIEGTNQNGQEVIRRADRYEVVCPDFD